MKKATVIINPETAEAAITERARSLLEKDFICDFVSPEKLNPSEDCDIAVAIGGDGTILSVGRKVIDRKIPIFGINAGHLGFLTTAEIDDIDRKIAALTRGEYTVEERITLSVKTTKAEYACINEAVLHRGEKPHLLRVGISVNGQETDVLRGDGILVATPTGSTAYNLSAGGPIIEPTAVNMVVTPVCAHSLTARPIVLSAKDDVKITVYGDGSDASLSIDGISIGTLAAGESASVSVGEKTLRLIKVGENNFYKILRKKLSGK